MGIKSTKGRNLFNILNYNKSGNIGETITEVIPPITRGGITTETATHRYHVFLEPGTFDVSSDFPGVADVLIIGGGGGGGAIYYGGGGGAGAAVHGNQVPLVVGSYTVGVGSGATITAYAGNAELAAGDNGFPSYIRKGTFNVEALGGGGGGGYSVGQQGSPGGCGGGNSYYSTSPYGNLSIQNRNVNKVPSEYIAYGYRSGESTPSPGYGGGGGGTGGTGTANGGSGRAFPQFSGPIIAPTIPAPVRTEWVSEVGIPGTYGGGGGGYPAGTGGSGGGGNSSSPGVAGYGVSFTGGGGGAADWPNSPTSPGSAGGPGIVIIRYTR